MSLHRDDAIVRCSQGVDRKQFMLQTAVDNILIAYYTADENTEVDAVTSASVVAVDGEDKGRVRSVADMIRR